MVARPVSPVLAPQSGGLDQKLAQLAQAISGKADKTSDPTFASVALIAPDGSTWRLTVTNTGGIYVNPDPRP